MFQSYYHYNPFNHSQISTIIIMKDLQSFWFNLPVRYTPIFLLCDHQLLHTELCILEETVTQTQVTKKKHTKLYWTSMEMWKSVQLRIIIFHNPVQIIMLPQKRSADTTFYINCSNLDENILIIHNVHLLNLEKQQQVNFADKSSNHNILQKGHTTLHYDKLVFCTLCLLRKVIKCTCLTMTFSKKVLLL